MAGPMDGFMDALMKMWPDWAAGQGLSPPDDGTSAVFDAPPVGNGGMVAQPPVAPDAPAPAYPPPVANATQQLPPPQDAATAAADVPAMNVDAATLMNGIQPGMAPTTDAQLFPTDMLQPPQADVNAAPPIEAPQSPLAAAAGSALSGLKTPGAPQYSAPSAPGVPGTHDINTTLMQLLQAAGLTAPQTPVGLQLGSRIR